MFLLSFELWDESIHPSASLRLAPCKSGKERTIMKTIVVAEYDPMWPRHFEQLRSTLQSALGDTAQSIEHVGSTSIPGLAAKPIIDVSVIVAGEGDVAIAIELLAAIGYVHRGNLGIEGREAFDNPDGPIRHHLYVCPRDSLALANLLTVRDYLRAHPDAALEYGELKKQLAAEFPHDVDSYVAGKTGFVLRILRLAGFGAAQLQAIAAANRTHGHTRVTPSSSSGQVTV
jgi:GrpB-like predicted nucleotidyltransferase (UPF0157 family)